MDKKNNQNFNNENFDYQFEELYNNQKPLKNIKNWNSRFGFKILKNNQDGSKLVQFNILIDNKNYDVYLLGNFNNWKKNENFKLEKDNFSVFASLKIDNLFHKTKYKYLIVDIKNDYEFIIQDPAGVYFDDDGNSILWDFNDISTYKQKFDLVNNFERSIKIVQTDLPGLIKHWSDQNGIKGSEIKEKQYYKFISESGVIDEIKSLGFNTIQFLPFAQSIDGDNWKFRYLVPFQFAIQKNWGNPDDFAKMIDEFHKNGISVIGDFVLGHIPNKDYLIFGQNGNDHGIHQFKKSNGQDLYLGEDTLWGTKRIDFDNPLVREFFVSSCLHFLKYYKIDGFRVDNVDGIIRYGGNGQGEERPNGRKFLREINSEIYSYNPSAIINFEAHYFAGDNAKLLTSPIKSNDRALGATAYNSSRLTYYFHTEYMFKEAKKIETWKFKQISEEKEWGKSNSTVADFHNHDAAAGLMEMRCTGSYAYDSMLSINPTNHIHAVGKIKVMEAIISFFTEGRTLNLIQTFLLQPGTFEHDTSIWWYLTFNEINKAVLNYKKTVNKIMDNPAFWPINVKYREYLNIDEKNKILVIERFSKGNRFICIINISDWTHYNYKVGVKTKNNYELILNSDKFEFGGFGIVSYPEIFENKNSNNFKLLDREIELPIIAPYGIIVLKEINN